MSMKFSFSNIVMAWTIGFLSFSYALITPFEASGFEKTPEALFLADRIVGEGAYSRTEYVDGIRIDFSVDYMGYRTHYITARFYHRNRNHPFEDVEGQISVIGPDGHEQIENMENYFGTFSTVFNIYQQGYYRVICRFEADGKKYKVAFRLPHTEYRH